MKRRVLLALGSNQGERHAQLAAARQALANWGTIQALSAVQETAAWGAQEAPAYLNQIVDLASDLLPWHLHAACKSYERACGRESHSLANQPRVIDLDLLLAEGLTMRAALCTIPHPRLWRRRFLHEPMASLPSLETWRPALLACGFWA